MKKRIISILLVICMGLTLMPATVLAASLEATSGNVANLAESGPTTTFKDVSKSDWFYSSVQYVLEHNIFNGTGKDTFSPYGTVTRGMYVTVLGRIAGVIPSEYQGKGDFKDVDKDAYYALYVAWAVKKGITAGVGNNRFDPDGIVTREQMAVFTVRYFEIQDIIYGGSTDVTTTPGDLTSVSGWAQEAVLKLWKTGLLKGDNNGNFNPKSNTTRAEIATFSVRTNEKVETWRAEKAGITPTPTPTSPTPTPTPVSGTPGNTNSGSMEYYTVTFESNGGTDVSPVSVARGGTLSSFPYPNKTNAVFLGWYSDSSLQGDKFSEEDAIYSNRTLYAKYLAIEGAKENELDTSFSLPEQDSDLAINVLSSSVSISAAEVKSGIMLEIINGSEPVNLAVNGSNGVFTVTAIGGFTEGASYKLTLSREDLSFSGKDDIIRTCSFTIKKSEVFDIEMNEGIVYIPSSDLSDIIKNGTPVNSLKVPLIDDIGDHSASHGTNSGTFTYNGIKVLNAGDVLCVYSGAKPVAGDDAAYLDEDIAYIEVTGKSGTTIDYADADSKDILFLPDVLPIYAGVDSSLINYTKSETSGSFSVPLSSLDFSQYSVMGLNSETTIDKGDYLALYTSASLQAANENDIIFGEVTTITTSDGTANVTFDITTSSAMQESLDYYSKNDIKGDTMLKDTDVGTLQSEIQQQVYNSGFANKAAEYMTSIAMSTDSFKKIAGDNFTLADNSQGAIDSTNGQEMKVAASGMDAIKDIKISVNVGTNTKKLKDGVRCAVQVSFNIPVKVNDDNEVKINISATFIEELKMTVNASGETVWKYLWGFIPYISEYNVNANVDVYDFTGIYFSSTITSTEAKDDGSGTKTEETDISQEIQDILSKTNTKVITAKVQSLFKDYSDMMENSHDWINIVDKKICSTDVAPILGILAVDASASFEVSIDVNVALGCNFEYQNGTRYCFWAKVLSAQAGSSTVSLADETYTFQLYIMGTLGLRAGIKLGFSVGLFSTDLDSVGLTAEAGIYANLYGYFYYELKSVNGVKASKKSGALYFELGAYLNINFDAQILSGALDYNPSLYEDEWPILTAGNRYNVSDFAYTNEPDITMKDKIRTFTLPKGVFDMSYLDLKEGDVSKKNYSNDNFAVTFSDRHFGLVGSDIVVIVPENIHFMECDMTVLWKSSSLAFSSVPIERIFHITWDDLNDGGYVILFNSNGGSAVDPIKKPYGANITSPSAPTKDGYTFAGWYSDKQLTIPYTFSKMGWDNIILYAKWTAKTNTPYKVNHWQQDIVNSSNYTTYETSSGLTGTTGASVTPAVRNYTGFTAPATQTVTIAPDGSTVVNYYYNRNSYKLTFKPENGGADISTNVKYSASITAPAVARTGYTFKGWNTAVLATMAAADATYTAQWTVNTYTVSFDSNGGSSCSSITITYDSAYGALPVPTRTGYTFNGWYTSETGDNGSGTQITSAAIANIITAQTLHAKWTASNATAYKVEHYQQNTSDNNYTLAETENLNGTTGATATATEKSYTGFTYDSNVSGTVGSGTIAADGSLVLKMYYTRNSYTLTFDANGGTGGSSTQVKYGAEIAAPNVTKTGYTFANWSPAVASIMPVQDTTYTAQWTASNSTAYKVEHYQQNISDNNYTLAETENLNGTTDATATATEKSYTGFTYDSNVSGTVGSGTIAADGSLVLKMYYTRNSYTLTFDANSGTGGSSTQVKYGAEIAAPNVTKTGYTFANWSPAVASIMPAQDTTYTARWTADTDTTYKVNHYQQNVADNNYTLYETQDLKGATDANVTPDVNSYTGFTTPSTQSVNIKADGSTVVNYYYTRNSYTLTFDANGGDGGVQVSIKYGASITVPVVTKSGYSFSGWDTAVAGTMPAADTTYNAQWATVNYKIRFDGNAADAAGSMADQSFSGVAAQNLTANGYTRTGYTFTGWNTAADGSGTKYENKASVSSLTTVNNNTVILYAQWKPSLSSGIFNSQYSAKYQVFDFIVSGTKINGNAYDSSWGTAGASGGHQFSDAMLAGRYFAIRKTEDATNPIALYMYEADGTPVVQGTSANLYPSSLIGSDNNVNLTASCRTSLSGMYGTDWAKGLVAVGNISSLWDEGFQFTSANGFGYFISGTTAYSTTGAITLHNQISNPSIAQIEAVNDFEAGPLTAPN